MANWEKLDKLRNLSMRCLRAVLRVPRRALQWMVGPPSDIAELKAAISHLQEEMKRLTGSVGLLAELHAQRRARDRQFVSSSSEGPHISIILPTWNRAEALRNAIDSVRQQTFENWELLIIDDGSSDTTCEVVAGYGHDARVRYFYQDHAGVAVARNCGLHASRGDIIAYLDSDNLWYPTYLEEVALAFVGNPKRQSVYLIQLVDAEDNRRIFLRGEPFDQQRLEQDNYIDLNVFAHRREVALRSGGFDPLLKRLSDWDLILRLTRDSAPVPIVALGGRYRTGEPGRITQAESRHRALYQVNRKREKTIKRPLRVLYLLHSFPQISETYVKSEMDYMRRRGVHVEVWSSLEPAAPYHCDVPTHRGTFEQALRAASPDLVHIHWLCFGENHLEMIHRAGVRVTYRGHGFEYSDALLRRLLGHPAVHRLYVYPHFAARLPASEKIRPMPVAFDPSLYYPAEAKDRRLVVRAGLAKATKDPEAFFRTACNCPGFRFVYAACTATHLVKGPEELRTLGQRLNSPVELRVDVPHDNCAELVRSAGIFLHTFGFQEPFGMPISIAEAMATGAYVLVRRGPGVTEYLGPCGAQYDSPEDAARLIRETQLWSEDKWQSVRLAAIDYAYARFADSTVLETMLDDWCALAGELNTPKRAAA